MINTQLHTIKKVFIRIARSNTVRWILFESFPYAAHSTIQHYLPYILSLITYVCINVINDSSHLSVWIEVYLHGKCVDKTIVWHSTALLIKLTQKKTSFHSSTWEYAEWKSTTKRWRADSKVVAISHRLPWLAEVGERLIIWIFCFIAIIPYAGYQRIIITIADWSTPISWYAMYGYSYGFNTFVTCTR